MSGGFGGWRRQAALGALLAVVACVLANRVARRALDLRLDLTADRLHTASDVGVRLLDGLEDVLQVRAYFTGYAARYLEEWHLAARKLQEALASGQFDLVDRRLREDLRACRSELEAPRPAPSAPQGGQLVLPQ